MRYKAHVTKVEWIEASQKGWVEFMEMLVSQQLPKVPLTDLISLFKKIVCFQPIEHPLLWREFRKTCYK